MYIYVYIYIHAHKNPNTQQKASFLPSCMACKVLRPIGGGSWRPSSPSWKGCTPVLGDQYSSPLQAGCNSDWKEKERDYIFMTGCHFKIDTVFRGGSTVQSRYNADLSSSVMLLGQGVYGLSHAGSHRHPTAFSNAAAYNGTLHRMESYVVSCPLDLTDVTELLQ